MIKIDESGMKLEGDYDKLIKEVSRVIFQLAEICKPKRKNNKENALMWVMIQLKRETEELLEEELTNEKK